MDVTGQLKAYGVQWHQELVGTLIWEVEIGKIDILLEIITAVNPLGTTMRRRYKTIPPHLWLPQYKQEDEINV